MFPEIEEFQKDVISIRDKMRYSTVHQQFRYKEQKEFFHPLDYDDIIQRSEQFSDDTGSLDTETYRKIIKLLFKDI